MLNNPSIFVDIFTFLENVGFDVYEFGVNFMYSCSQCRYLIATSRGNVLHPRFRLRSNVFGCRNFAARGTFFGDCGSPRHGVHGVFEFHWF